MTTTRLDSHLSSLISHLYLLLLFFLPLLFSMKSSEVFEFPKMLFVYAMTTLIVACWIGRMIVNKKIIFARTPLDIPVFLFLLSQLLSTLFSIDVHTSLFGYYSRWSGGLLSTIAYTLLYAAYTSNKLQETRDKRGVAQAGTPPSARSESPSEDVGRGAATRQDPVMIALLSSATLVAAYALLQRLGIDRDLWVQDVVSRVFSTQGQPNWLAAYLVMVMPFAWMLTVNSYLRSHNLYLKSQSLQRFLLHMSFYTLALIYATTVAFTRSRSGLFGLAVADVVFWGLLFLKRSDLGVRQGQTFRGSDLFRKKLFSYSVIRLFGFVHITLFIVFLMTNNPAREWISQRIQNLEFRIQNFSSPDTRHQAPDTNSITPSSDIRKIVWRGALELVKQRPLFGWGPETFAYTYWRVRPATHNLTSEWNFLYNKAHNEWLNFAANTGLVGLGTHLLLLGWFTVWTIHQLVARGHSVLSSWSKDTRHEEPSASRASSFVLRAALLAATLGVESVNFFGFSTVTTQAYSYIFMGIAVVTISKIKNQKSKMGNHQNELRITNYELRIPFTVYCLLFTVSLAALYLLSQLFFSFFADLSYNRGKQFAKSGYLPEALEAATAAVNLVPDEPVFRSELAETQGVLAISLALSEIEGLATATSLKDSSLENFRIVGKQSPVNVSFLRTRARVTYALGSLDPSLYDQGIALMERAMEFAPTDPKIPYNLGVMLQDSGQSDEAKLSFEKALELKPDYEEAKRALENIGN